MKQPKRRSGPLRRPKEGDELVGLEVHVPHVAVPASAGAWTGKDGDEPFPGVVKASPPAPAPAPACPRP
jgi:hypothetical protein